MPQKQHKKRHLGSSSNSIVRRKAEHRDHVWCWDFIYDSDFRGRSLKWLSIMDEFTRECLVLEVERSITSRDVIPGAPGLAELLIIRGVPGCIRSDNGPEFIAEAIKSYLKRANVGTLYIEKGAPWENGYAESFHGRVRDPGGPGLNVELFLDVRDAKGHAARWKNEYNHRRPSRRAGIAGARSPGEVRGDVGPPSGRSCAPLSGQTNVNLLPCPDSHSGWYIKRGQVTRPRFHDPWRLCYVISRGARFEPLSKSSFAMS